MEILARPKSLTEIIETTPKALYIAWALLVFAGLIQNLVLESEDTRIWLLDLDVERSLYTWFSQILLAGAAVLLANIAVSIITQDRFMGVQFLILALLVTAMSIDEGLSLHEKLSDVLRHRFNSNGYFTFAWILPATALVLAALVAFIPFLLRLDPSTRFMLLLSATIFFTGAIGFEMVGGKFFSSSAGDVTTAAYRFSTVIEEALEGLGVISSIHTLLILRRRLGIKL